MYSANMCTVVVGWVIVYQMIHEHLQHEEHLHFQFIRVCYDSIIYIHLLHTYIQNNT